MSIRQENYNSANHPAFPSDRANQPATMNKLCMAGPSNASNRLEMLLSQSGNRGCADCGSPDPKWVSLNHGVFICIKCSGIHRSLGVHISKVLSVNLDEWTDDQIDSLIDAGGNAVVNMRYEAFLPEDFKKPKPDSPLEERFDFIKRKYELQEFSTVQTVSSSTVSSFKSPMQQQNHVPKNKYLEKQHTGLRHGLAQAFRNSWKKKGSSEHNTFRTTMGMVEFIGLIKVTIIRGTDLAVRDVLTSDPYVVISLGRQTMKTRVVRRSLNPVWNESLMLSIPEPVPPLRLRVLDKDRFSSDDEMGEAEIDIQPLVSLAKAYENCDSEPTKQVGRWLATDYSALVKDSVFSLVDGGKVKQEISLKLQNVESGHLDLELQCVPLSQ